MPRKKKRTSVRTHRSSRNDAELQGFYNPFDGLDQHLRKSPNERAPKKLPPQPTAAPAARAAEDEDALFMAAMADVTPLAGRQAERVPPPSPAKQSPRFRMQEDEEVMLQLMQLVSGEGSFELSYSDEYVDGAVVGLSPKILKKLRNGDLSYQDYVDLHGFKRDQAYDVVLKFLHESFVRGLRCVLIISGRGLNSRERKPVLKENLVAWLTRAPLKHLVLAFASARSYDGGVGAFYVLMRKRPGKCSFVTPIT